MSKPQRTHSIGDFTAILRRRWPYLVTIMPAGVLLGVFIAFVLPASYTATATILLEPSSIPQELVKTTVISYADQQIELVRRTVMSTSRLEPVVDKVDPYPDRADLTKQAKAFNISQDTMIEKVDPVTLEPLLVSPAFSVHYSNPDPQVAAAVAREIANLFLEHNRETRTEAARQAQFFLAQRSGQVEEQIRQMDQRLAEFKRQYGDALPEAQVRNEASLDRTQRDIDALNAQIRIAEQQESLLRLQLNQVSPTLMSAGTDAYTQLGVLRSELAAAQQKYTPDHPDVKRLTRAIEALLASSNIERAENVRPDNPDYLRISSELESARRNLAALRSQASRAQSQSADYARRLTLAPNVERDYMQLVRTREMAQQQFQEIQLKLNEAEVATNLESEARGERFTLIREPYAPSTPSEPNRLGLILLAFVLSGGIAVAAASLKESSDPTVRGSLDLRDLGKFEVIGAIPKLRTRSDRKRRGLVFTSAAVAYGLAAVVVALTVLGAGKG